MLFRIVALVGAVAVIVSFYVYTDREALNELFNNLRNFTPIYALAATFTDLWLRNDKDIVPGFAKVDDLLFFSIFQTVKQPNANFTLFLNLLDECTDPS